MVSGESWAVDPGRGVDRIIARIRRYRRQPRVPKDGALV